MEGKKSKKNKHNKKITKKKRNTQRKKAWRAGAPIIRLGFFCTRGRHRSVAAALLIAAGLAENGFDTQVEHMDLHRHECYFPGCACAKWGLPGVVDDRERARAARFFRSP